MLHIISLQSLKQFFQWRSSILAMTSYSWLLLVSLDNIDFSSEDALRAPVKFSIFRRRELPCAWSGAADDAVIGAPPGEAFIARLLRSSDTPYLLQIRAAACSRLRPLVEVCVSNLFLPLVAANFSKLALIT